MRYAVEVCRAGATVVLSGLTAAEAVPLAVAGWVSGAESVRVWEV